MHGARRSGASATASFEEILPPRLTPTFREPDPAAGLPQVLIRCVARPLPCRARRLAPGHSRVSGHDELHGHAPGEEHGLLDAGPPSIDIVSNDHYLDGSAARPTRQPLVLRRPDPRPGRRSALDADGALLQRRQLAAAQLRQGAWAADPQQPSARRSRRRLRAASSSGGRPGLVRRSFTPAWSRTPAPTPRSGAT